MSEVLQVGHVLHVERTVEPELLRHACDLRGPREWPDVDDRGVRGHDPREQRT